MSKRAIRTSRKRVDAMLRAERNRIRQEERAAAEYGATFGRTRLDDNGDIWLTQKPQRPHWTVAIPPPMRRYVPGFFDFPLQMRVIPVHFRAVDMMVRLPDGQRLRWVNWEACL